MFKDKTRGNKGDFPGMIVLFASSFLYKIASLGMRFSGKQSPFLTSAAYSYKYEEAIALPGTNS
jgi:hypothetical protein